jgi:hypothetical protein
MIADAIRDPGPCLVSSGQTKKSGATEPGSVDNHDFFWFYYMGL